MGVSDEVVHKAAEGGENLSEYVAQRELSGQQCDGELLWTLKSKRFTMGASTIATRSSRRRLRNISSTTTSTALRNLSPGSVLHSIAANISPHRKSAGNLFLTLSGLTFWGHYPPASSQEGLFCAAPHLPYTVKQGASRRIKFDRNSHPRYTHCNTHLIFIFRCFQQGGFP